MTTLVRSSQPGDDALDVLAARVAELESLLGDRLGELEQARTDLAAFRVEYRHKVGRLHEELDEVELLIAEVELGVLKEQLADRLRDAEARGQAGPEGQTDSAARFTSDAVRRLFRDVAKAIHPDLAEDEEARERRHRLMIEANRAYARGDEERLRWILESWERRPEAIVGEDAESIRSRLLRRQEQLDEQLEACASELASLQETPMWKLKTMVDEAAASGKDLVADMVRRLKIDLMVARNKLAAIQSTP